MSFYLRAFLLLSTVWTFQTAPARSDELGPTLQKIRDTGTISIGHRESSIPLSYLDGDGKPIGFSMELCNRIVGRIRAQMNMPNLKIEYFPVNSSNRIPLVKNGSVDIECGSTANTALRQGEVSFSVAFFSPQNRWLVRSDSSLHSTADLRGKIVAVTQGAVSGQIAKKISDERKLDLKFIQGRDHAESFLLVETGRVAAFMEDDINLAGLRANSKDPASFRLLDEGFPSDIYGLMFQHGDAKFKQLVDDTLIGLMKSGEFQQLYVKWFESPIPPKRANLQFPMSVVLKDLIKNPSDKPNS
jgi:glutamate/aspartate transport system substrate-binding protein